ncbi:MAG TPA: response regulator transcription factor [Trueperaceae bacterium]
MESMQAQVLIIEDEPAMAEILADNLREEGFGVELAPDGPTGAERWRKAAPDLVVLDVMLPRMNGFELCRRMREAGDRTPVLFLSARGQPEDRVEGLSAGGDDYLPKPFHLPEFLLRVQNMLRRRHWGQAPGASFSFGGHLVDYRGWTAQLADGGLEPLGERELKIFRLLAERRNEVVSRDDILDEVWGGDTFPSSRTVDNFVVRLRRLFEPDPGRPIYFHTVWGVGYKFTPEGEPEGNQE